MLNDQTKIDIFFTGRSESVRLSQLYELPACDLVLSTAIPHPDSAKQRSRPPPLLLLLLLLQITRLEEGFCFGMRRFGVTRIVVGCFYDQAPHE
jgi:hypothetical protein